MDKELTDAEIAELERKLAAVPDWWPEGTLTLHERRACFSEDPADKSTSLFPMDAPCTAMINAAVDALPKLLAERKADKAEVKRLEHIVRHAGVMLAACVEYKQQGMCKDAAVNRLLKEASEPEQKGGE